MSEALRAHDSLSPGLGERDPVTLRLHEAAEQVPRMRPDEWTAFLTDVDSQGVLEPIVITAEGVILDGRHRWEAARACDQSVIPVREVSLTTVEQVEYIFRAAVLRRHLSDDQRAVLAARMREPLSKAMQSEAARKAGQAGGRGRPRTDDSDSHTSCESLSGNTPEPAPKTDTRQVVAEQFNVPRRKVQQAIQLEREAPRLAEEVLSGQKSLREAQREQVKAVEVQLASDLETAGIHDLPKVRLAHIRSRFSTAAGTLTDLEPGEVVAAASSRDELTIWLRMFHDWCERLEQSLADSSLRVIEGGRS